MRAVLDNLNWVVALVLHLVVFSLAATLGSFFGRKSVTRSTPEQRSHVDSLSTTMLALLGLLTAFTFTIAEERYLLRRQLILREANAIGTTYLRAGTLPEQHTVTARRLLTEYTDVRLSVRSPADLPRGLKEGARLQRAIWTDAEHLARADPSSEMTSLYLDSLNRVIDLHEERVVVGQYARLPGAMYETLYLMALLSMVLLGYSSGLAGVKSLLHLLGAVLPIASIVFLIGELDRPWSDLFRLSLRALEDVRTGLM